MLVERLGGLAPRPHWFSVPGLGGLVEEVENAVRISYADLPGFPKSGVTGHAGEVVAGHFAGVPVLMLAGRVHYYETRQRRCHAPGDRDAGRLGVTHLILTNAAGSLEPDMPPGSVMQITDHINFSGINPLFGEPTTAVSSA